MACQRTKMGCFRTATSPTSLTSPAMGVPRWRSALRIPTHRRLRRALKLASDCLLTVPRRSGTPSRASVSATHLPAPSRITLGPSGRTAQTSRAGTQPSPLQVLEPPKLVPTSSTPLSLCCQRARSRHSFWDAWAQCSAASLPSGLSKADGTISVICLGLLFLVSVSDNCMDF